MPNWCSNNLTLEHDDPEMIKKAIEGFNRGELFATFFPCPQDLLEGSAPADGKVAEANMEKHGAKDWYDWCVNNWGTKWDISNDGGFDAEPSDDGKSVFLSYETAWSPPIGFYQEMEDQLGFKVRATYFEPGMSVVGEYSDGADDEYEIDPENLDEIPDNLREEYGIDSWYEEDDSEE